jgi:hypothetical protein
VLGGRRGGEGRASGVCSPFMRTNAHTWLDITSPYYCLPGSARFAFFSRAVERSPSSRCFCLFPPLQKLLRNVTHVSEMRKQKHVPSPRTSCMYSKAEAPLRPLALARHAPHHRSEFLRPRSPFHSIHSPRAVVPRRLVLIGAVI